MIFIRWLTSRSLGEWVVIFFFGMVACGFGSVAVSPILAVVLAGLLGK